jgi:hypothetical protein
VRKLAALAMTALLAGGGLGAGLGVAHASAGQLGSPSLYGLCVAYFSGSTTGQGHKHNAPPFQALKLTAGGLLHVALFCLTVRPGNNLHSALSSAPAPQ